MRPSRTRSSTSWRPMAPSWRRARLPTLPTTPTKRRNSPSRAPDEVGEYSWTVVFPKHEAEGLVHEEGSLPITVRTMAHDTSLAVWGVPSPIVIDHPFRIHVGATCSSGCDLTGREIQICDETGASIARGKLGETPWDGTRALYWTEVDLVAPAREGATSRSISVRTDRIAAAPRRGVGPIRIRDGQAAAVFGDGQGRPEGRRHACRGCAGAPGRVLRLFGPERPGKDRDAPRNIRPGRAQDRL